MSRASDEVRYGGKDVLVAEESERAKGVRLPFSFPEQLLLPLFLFLVAMGFNLYRLGVPSIWFDEAFSVELARQPLPLLWRIIFGQEPNMELYYLLLHGWLGLCGLFGLNPTEFMVRLPSALFAGLSSVVVFLLARRFLDRLASVAGTLLYLLNNLQLVYAQQTRAYSLQLLLLCISWYALFVVLSQESKKRIWWLCYILSTVLAIYTHLFSALVVLAQLVALAGLLLIPNPWRTRLRAQTVPLLASLCTIALLIVPMALVAREGAKTGWLTSPSLTDLYQFVLVIGGYNKYYILALAASCTLAVLWLLYYLLFRSRRNVGRAEPASGSMDDLLPLAWSLLCWLLVPLIVSYLVSQGSLRLFSSRYLVVIIPALFLLLALGLALVRNRRVQALISTILCILALSTAPMYYASAQVEDWNSTSAWLQQQYRPGDGLVCYHNDVQQGCQIAMEYYFHAYPSGAHFTDDAPGSFSWQNFGPRNPASGPEAAVDPAALQVYGAQHARLFFIVGRLPDQAAADRAQAAQSWLDSHYRLIGQISKRTVTIRLYDTSHLQ